MCVYASVCGCVHLSSAHVLCRLEGDFIPPPPLNKTISDRKRIANALTVMLENCIPLSPKEFRI